MSDELEEQLGNEIPVEKIVKFIRMKNGDDLVAQFITFSKESEDGEGYDMHHMFVCPLKITHGVREDNTLVFILTEWVPSEFCSDQEFTVYPDEIITVGSASASLIDQYFYALDKLGMVNGMKDKLTKPNPVENINLKTIPQGVPVHSNTVFDLAEVNVHRKVRN